MFQINEVTQMNDVAVDEVDLVEDGAGIALVDAEADKN